MWGESSKNCEINCQCSGLLTETFKINSGNNATKRKQETALTHNYKLKMNPHSIDFNKSPLNSPINTTKRRILGEIQNFKPTSPYIERLKNSPLPDLKSPSQSPSKSPFNSSSYSSHSPLAGKQFSSNSPLSKQFSSNSPLSRQQFSPNSPSIKPFSSNSPLSKPLSSNSPLSKPYSSNFNAAQSIKSPLLNSPIISTHSPLTTRVKRTSKISRIFEERTKFKMESKENKENEFSKLHFEEETRDCSFSGRLDEGIEKWGSSAKLDFTDALPSKYTDPCVPENENQDLDDLESLQDLEAQFDSETFEQCTKYEIISTDSPEIISRGRTGRKITSKHFSFGAPISESEQSTSFNRPATRMLTFDEDEFEFPSPAVKKTVSVKKSLKFNETPTKYSLRPERSDSSIGSMSLSPASSKLRLFTSDSTTSMESGFISELEEPFLEIEDSNSPKIANFDALISGKIKENIITDKNFLKRPSLARSLSFQPESRAKMSLLSILESPERRNKKRVEREEELEKCSKRRKSEAESPAKRPALQRAFSENNASIMSALAKSVVQPDLTGDFSRVCALPLAAGGAPDLRTVGPDTLAALLRGDYSHLVDSYTIIDCRYPYEFAGGHVQGAINLYTEEQVQDLVLRPPPDTPADRRHRHVLVFHCEYSIQRGPALSRCLRAFDRRVHRASYPSLRFPELYVVAGGYRAFHARHPALCHPRGYTAMTDPRHRHLLRQHRRH